jgi:hypothetical protein
MKYVTVHGFKGSWFTENPHAIRQAGLKTLMRENLTPASVTGQSPKRSSCLN